MSMSIFKDCNTKVNELRVVRENVGDVCAARLKALARAYPPFRCQRETIEWLLRHVEPSVVATMNSGMLVAAKVSTSDKTIDSLLSA